MWVAGAQYKFIVDGDWKYAPDQPAMYDEDNNVNNVLEVQEYVPENLASLSSFDPPPSPPERWVVCHAGVMLVRGDAPRALFLTEPRL